MKCVRTLNVEKIKSLSRVGTILDPEMNRYKESTYYVPIPRLLNLLAIGKSGNLRVYDRYIKLVRDEVIPRPNLVCTHDKYGRALVRNPVYTIEQTLIILNYFARYYLLKTQIVRSSHIFEELRNEYYSKQNTFIEEIRQTWEKVSE